MLSAHPQQARFPGSVREKLGYYVYTLTAPRHRRPFYVGKGTGNRVFDHASGRLRRTKVSDKIEKIHVIQRNRQDVRYEIIRHGMDRAAALEVEAALIDFIGLQELTNEIEGHGTALRGRMTISEIFATYRPRRVRIREPVLLIIVNKLYRRNASAKFLYEITRGNWVLGPRREQAQFALSIYSGVVRQAYRIDSWARTPARSRKQKRQSRWRFTGVVAKELQHYLGRSVAGYLKRGAQSPVRYLNCKPM